MKKITESQLKDKVNSLREYLKVYENQQVDEWSMLSPSSWFNGRDYGDSTSRDDVRTQDAAKNSTAGGNMALVQNREQLAPGSVASEQGKDGVTYAVDAKGMRTFKIENNKWVAMNPPTPTENPMLQGVPDAQQAASVTPAAPTSTQVQTDDNGNHLITTPDGKTMVVGPDGKPLENGGREVTASRPDPAKVARFKELLAKAGVAAAPAPAPGANVAFGQGAKLRANESTNYFLNKLRLIESRQLNEALTPEESKELDKLYGELSVDSQGNVIKDNPELAPLFADYQKIPSVTAAAPAAPAEPAAPAAVAAPAEPAAPAAVAAPAEPAAPAAVAAPAQAASVSTAGPVTWKQIYELNKDVIGKNPNLIKPGQQLKMPDGSTYTVKPGDNLSKIAKNAGAGQGAKTAPVLPGTGMQGSDQGAKTAPTGITPGQNARDDLLARQGAKTAPTGITPGQNARDDLLARQGAKTAPTGITPGQNARDDLLARQGKGQKTIDLSNSSKYTDGTPRVKAESVGYNELQRIVSLVNHR